MMSGGGGGFEAENKKVLMPEKRGAGSRNF